MRQRVLPSLISLVPKKFDDYIEPRIGINTVAVKNIQRLNSSGRRLQLWRMHRVFAEAKCREHYHPHSALYLLKISASRVFGLV